MKNTKKINKIILLTVLLSLALFTYTTAQGVDQSVNPSFEVLKNIPLPEKAAVGHWNDAIPFNQLVEEEGKTCFCSELIFCSFECLDSIHAEEHDTDCTCAIQETSTTLEEEVSIMAIPCDCGGYIISKHIYTSGWRFVDAYACKNSSHKVDCAIKKYVRDNHYEYSCSSCGYYHMGVTQEYKEEHY